jgi:hypothetical protein
MTSPNVRSSRSSDGHQHVEVALASSPLRDIDDEVMGSITWKRGRARSLYTPSDGATYDDRDCYPRCAALDCETHLPLPHESSSVAAANARHLRAVTPQQFQNSDSYHNHQTDIAAAAASVKQCEGCIHAVIWLCARHQALHHQVTGH